MTQKLALLRTLCCLLLRYARKISPKATSKGSEGWWDGPEYARYSEQTRRSLANVDEDQVGC